MQIPRITPKIGKFLAIAALLGAAPAWADPQIQFTAEVDRQEIGQDDTVSLKFNLQTDGSVNASAPTYTAPDFEVVNSYDSSYSESYYDSSTNHFGMKNTQQLTKVLRPNKTGELKISRIQITVNGRVFSAPDIFVRVGPAGGGTPPPRNYGGSGVGLRGAAKNNHFDNIILRAEVGKEKVYKGEQVIVSYYLYRRIRVLNVQVETFPVLTGFLREELEMPVMQTRMDSEQVVLDGVAYQRSLLARYAAYPLQEGKLVIDPMGLKYSYFPNPGITDDGEDQDPIFNFFRAMAPSESKIKSEPVKIDVVPLPADGRPASFSGGVGDFNVIAAIDKTEVRANEAVTLTVKVEGRGNVAAIGEPKLQLPPSVELYDSKGKAKTGRGGVGEKIFEILLIPREAGPLTLPGVEFSFFDPSKKQYIVRKTDSIQVTVKEGAPGSAPAPAQPGNSTQSANPSTPDIPATPQATMRDLHPPSAGDGGSLGALGLWRVVYYAAGLLFFGFLGLVARDSVLHLRQRGRETMESRSKSKSRQWSRLQAQAREAANGSLPWSDVAKAYENLESLIFEALDDAYSIGARSYPRAELGRLMVGERGFDQNRWEQIGKLLEYAEMVRFAGATGGAFEQKARADLVRWVGSAESSIQSLQKI